MPGSTFQTNPYDLDKLLQDCHRGTLQLPDFQRSWVWDEDRIVGAGVKPAQICRPKTGTLPWR